MDDMQKISSLIIAQVEPPEDSEAGDYFYRTYAPGQAMANEAGTYIINITSQHRKRDEICKEADVLIIKNICDPDMLPMIRRRGKEGKLTLYEIADDLAALQPWNPVYFFFKNMENIELVQRLASCCNALQVTCTELKNLYGHLNPVCEVFPNQVSNIPPEKEIKDNGNLVVGWGGSHGHLEDVAEIANPLTDWIISRQDVSLHLMCSEPIWGLFDDIPPHRKKHMSTGPIDEYYNFLSNIDIGIAPLKDTPFNRSRSDIKFLEYAVAGVVPVMQHLAPYIDSVDNGRTGFMFEDADQMIEILNRLADRPESRMKISKTARHWVLKNRLEAKHGRKRTDFYKKGLLKLGTASIEAKRDEKFLQWSRLEGADKNGRHLELKSTKFEHLLYNGLIAMQIEKDRGLARHLFEEAADLEPSNYLPYLFGAPVALNPIDHLLKAVELKPDSLKAWLLLGDSFLKSGKIEKALICYESAARVYPEYDIPYLRAGELLEKVGHLSEAEKLFEKAEQLKVGPPKDEIH